MDDRDASFMGIGFGETRHHRVNGGSSFADVIRQRYEQAQQEGAALQGESYFANSFVASHVVDPKSHYCAAHGMSVPPPPPPPPPLERPRHIPGWQQTEQVISFPPPPPPPPPSLTSQSTRFRPFAASFSHYGTVARGRREDFISPGRLTSSKSTLGTEISEEMNIAVQVARERAMKVLQQINDKDQARADTEISRKRQAAFEQLNKRKKLAMVKNLEYLAKLEDERLEAKLLSVSKAEVFQAQLEAHHQESLQKRLQHFGKGNGGSGSVLSTQAGIGTQQRRQVEEKKRKQQNSSNDTVALYISNLPTDGSADEALLRSLFGGLGFSLRKIHLYTNKRTGELKGDALAIYGLNPDESRRTLIENVCSQMNRAELPCGTEISVEPSDPLFKLRKGQQESHYGPTLAVEQLPQEDDGATGDSDDQKIKDSREGSSNDAPNKTAEHGEDDTDLDDFFESLE